MSKLHKYIMDPRVKSMFYQPNKLTFKFKNPRRQQGGDSGVIAENKEWVKMQNGTVAKINNAPTHDEGVLVKGNTAMPVKKGNGGVLINDIESVISATHELRDNNDFSYTYKDEEIKVKPEEAVEIASQFGFKISKPTKGISPAKLLDLTIAAKQEFLKKYKQEDTPTSLVGINAAKANSAIVNSLPTDEELYDGIFSVQEGKKSSEQGTLMQTGGLPERYKKLGFTGVNQVKNAPQGDSHKKMVVAKKGDKYKLVKFGYRGMEDYTQHKDKDRRKNYLSRSAGIRNGSGQLTKDDVFSANHWSRKINWQTGGETNYAQNGKSTFKDWYKNLPVNKNDTTKVTPRSPYTKEQLLAIRKAKIAEDKKIIDDRKLNIAQANKARNNLNRFTPNNIAVESQAIGDKMRIFPNDPDSFIDDYLNPGVMIGNLASGIGQVPKNIQDDDYGKATLNLVAPIITGALSGMGAKTTGQFVNNLINPLAGTKGLAKYAVNKGVQAGKTLKNNVSKFSVQAKDALIGDKVVGQGDVLYPRVNNYLDDTYVNYDVRKKLEPYSDIIDDEIRRNPIEYRLPEVSQRLPNKVLPAYLEKDLNYFDNIAQQKAGKLQKQQYCLPGSPCAKSANSASNKFYTNLTGQSYDYDGNAHNAWNMLSKTLSNDGELIFDKSLGIPLDYNDLQIGDRVLMGRGEFNHPAQEFGHFSDQRVNHAATISGRAPVKVGDDEFLVPYMLESGATSGMYNNPIMANFYGGDDAIISVVRPSQFKDIKKDVLINSVKEEIKDLPPTNTFKVLDKNITSYENIYDKNKQTIKDVYDLNTDESDELFRLLIGIGTKESKMGAKLPGSILPKAKIILQETLNNTGLSSPVKAAMNAGKKVGNALKYTVDPNLAPFPGRSVVEMEAAKLAKTNNVSLEEAINELYTTKYNRPKPFAVSDTSPSKGVFKQKDLPTNTQLLGINKNTWHLSKKNEVLAGMGKLAEDYTSIKKDFPDLTKEQQLDLTVLKWNSPGKVNNRDLVDFFLLGKDNPDPSKFSFKYIDKVKKFRDQVVPITGYGNMVPHNIIPDKARYKYQPGGNVEYAQVGGRLQVFPTMYGRIPVALADTPQGVKRIEVLDGRTISMDDMFNKKDSVQIKDNKAVTIKKNLLKKYVR